MLILVNAMIHCYLLMVPMVHVQYLWYVDEVMWLWNARQWLGALSLDTPVANKDLLLALIPLGLNLSQAAWMWICAMCQCVLYDTCKLTLVERKRSEVEIQAFPNIKPG